MLAHEVLSAFDMLQEELEHIIPELNDQAKALMDQKKYDQAHALLNKAQSVVDFQGKVAALRDEWLELQVPATKATLPVPTPKLPKSKKTSRRTNLNRLETGLRTKNSDLFMPILRALANNGGKLQFQKLLSVLEKDLKDVLNEYDWQIMSDDKSIRWKNNVGWAKKHLSNAGYISNTAKRGFWEITELGREQMEESIKKSIAEPRQLYLTDDIALKVDSESLFTVGKSYHRQSELHDKFGGNRQSGISACAKHPIIFLFSAPTGKESGYKDGLASNDTYIYSGEGSVGDMEFTRGNKAILNHKTDGRELHLFKQEKSGLYQYIGQFEYESHKIVEGEDIEGNKRKLIQFTLNRIN